MAFYTRTMTWSSFFAFAVLCLLIAPRVRAVELLGLTLEQAIKTLQDAKVPIIYSSDVVKPWMRVREEPQGDNSRTLLEQMLAPYNLVPKDGPHGALLIVRDNTPVATSSVIDKKPLSETTNASPPPRLTEMIITASQYELTREAAPAAITMSSADLGFIPNPGNDPLRAAARLPGSAHADYTAKTNIRGGEANETLVRFDDLRLYNPFHLKDFQSIFSVIDPSITQQISVFTGGFPSTYGDRMSSVINIMPIQANDRPYRKISASFFNASALATGGFKDDHGDWVVSARRGNLDLFLDVTDPELGNPSFLDFYSHAGLWFTDSFRISGNLLLFNDDISLSDGSKDENAQAEYKDAYGWLRFDLKPNENLSGNVIWAHTELDSERAGNTNKSGISTGMLQEFKNFSIDSVQSDWSWHLGKRLNLSFGGAVTLARGRYRYADHIDFSLLFLTPGATLEPSRTTNLNVSVDGEYIGAYLDARYRLTKRLVAEAGLRWDTETVSPGSPHLFSPRLAFLYSLGDSTDLRVSWGRYYQTEAIDELQVSDEITKFSPPQRSDHFVLGMEHSFNNSIDFRLEAYYKHYDRLRPRYENFLNPIALLPELKPDRIRIAPVNAASRGIEATLRHTGKGPWNWWASYVWASAKDNFKDMTVRRAWDQTYNLDVGLGWRTDRWEFSLAGNYHTGWPTTSITLTTNDPVPLVTAGPRNEQRVGNYGSIDIRAAHNFHFSDTNSLSLFIEIANITDRSNNCCVKYEITDKGRTTLLKTKAVDSLPIIPSAGFAWRF